MTAASTPPTVSSGVDPTMDLEGPKARPVGVCTSQCWTPPAEGLGMPGQVIGNLPASSRTRTLTRRSPPGRGAMPIHKRAFERHLPIGLAQPLSHVHNSCPQSRSRKEPSR